jgi:hypothetical protein
MCSVFKVAKREWDTGLRVDNFRKLSTLSEKKELRFVCSLLGTRSHFFFDKAVANGEYDDGEEYDYDY